MKALVGAFNQEKALVGAFSVIVQPVVEPMEHYTALVWSLHHMSILDRDQQILSQPASALSPAKPSTKPHQPATASLRWVSLHGQKIRNIIYSEAHFSTIVLN